MPLYGVETGFPEFLRDVVRGRFVLGRTRDVRSLGENSQMLFSSLRIRYGEKA
jgi:hypothetical protein